MGNETSKFNSYDISARDIYVAWSIYNQTPLVQFHLRGFALQFSSNSVGACSQPIHKQLQACPSSLRHRTCSYSWLKKLPGGPFPLFFSSKSNFLVLTKNTQRLKVFKGVGKQCNMKRLYPSRGPGFSPRTNLLVTVAIVIVGLTVVAVLIRCWVLDQDLKKIEHRNDVLRAKIHTLKFGTNHFESEVQTEQTKLKAEKAKIQSVDKQLHSEQKQVRVEQEEVSNNLELLSEEQRKLQGLEDENKAEQTEIMKEELELEREVEDAEQEKEREKILAEQARMDDVMADIHEEEKNITKSKSRIEHQMQALEEEEAQLQAEGNAVAQEEQIIV